MKSSGVLSLLLFGLLSAHAHALSPITRVVELLTGLAEKIETEIKTEESLYEKYVCWATTVINAKTQSNKEAESRITTLKAYIEDLDAGRVELTSEREDLTTELKGLNSDIETANAMRAQEHEDFLMAKDEMEKAIAALDESITVLVAATKEHQEGVFIGLRQSAPSKAASLAQSERSTLDLAISLGRNALEKSDAEFLEKMLMNDVPTWDWKKLNRDATYKSSYKARSGRILEVLQELKQTFEANLAEAESKESQASSDHSALSSAKNAQKGSTEQSLNKMEVEGAARGESKMTAAEELAALEAQVQADEGFISATKDGLEKKKAEWKIRKDLRHAEVAAVNKAIAILRSDDARDLFKRSFKSQGFSFLSLRSSSARKLSSSAEEQRESLAASFLRSTAVKSGDARLRQLSDLVSSSEGHFDAVLKAIDKMVELLQKEEAKDLEVKETCEHERQANTRDAVVAARTVDEHTDIMSRLSSEIDALTKEIEQAEDEIKQIEEQMTEAGRIRSDEHSEWVKSNADDEEAAQVVQQAIDVLTTFYQENGLALLMQKGQQIPDVKAGEAPPPPPPTWEAPYGGAAGESDGIISILTMIREDILKDKQAAQDTETMSESAYNAFMQDCTFQIQNLQRSISSMNRGKSTKENNVAIHMNLRLSKKGELDALMSTMKELAPGCDFMTINYPMRVENRQIELDGLHKAKTILMGAVAGAPAPAAAS